MPDNQEQKKLAIVTGGASGIGLSVVERFAKEGFSVLIIDVNKEAGEVTKNDFISKGYDVNFASCNITKHSEVIGIFESLKTEGRAGDVLVNCAGISPSLSPLHKYSLEEWHRAIDINLHGTFYACREFLSLAVELSHRDAAIVNIASIMGVRASAAQAPYSASKHAVVGLTKSIAQDYAYMNIRANVVGPGVIETPMTKDVMASPEIMELMLDRIPLKRVAKADEVANLIYFLSSSEASYITGSYYPVDGGYLAG